MVTMPYSLRRGLAGLLLFAFVLIHTLRASASPLAIVDDSTERLELNAHLEMLLDPDRSLEFTSVKDPAVRSRFTPVLRRKMQMNPTWAAAWLRIEIECRASTERSMWLEVGQGLLDEARVYTEDAR